MSKQVNDRSREVLRRQPDLKVGNDPELPWLFGSLRQRLSTEACNSVFHLIASGTRIVVSLASFLYLFASCDFTLGSVFDQSSEQSSQQADSVRSEVNHDSQVEVPFRPDVLVVLGAGGTTEYEEQFKRWQSRLRELASTEEVRYRVIGADEEGAVQGLGDSSRRGEIPEGERKCDRQLLIDTISELNRETAEPLWLILIGHGTYTRGVAKFNLRGPDISSVEFAEQLQSLSRPLVSLNFFSASGPFINALSGENRVVVSATKSGQEQNFSRFGGYFIEALGDVDSDLDHDQQVSVLEAFLSASSRTQAYYDSEQRLLTEHALVDDNGDQRGTPAVFFRGIRAVRKTKSGQSVDGRLSARESLSSAKHQPALSAEQRRLRDQQERVLDDLVARESSMSRTEYLLELEKILVPLANIYGGETKLDVEATNVDNTAANDAAAN